MKVFETADFAGDATVGTIGTGVRRRTEGVGEQAGEWLKEKVDDLPRQTAVEGSINIISVHILEGGSGCRFSKVDHLIGTSRATDDHESAAADARVIHGCPEMRKGDHMNGRSGEPGDF